MDTDGNIRWFPAMLVSADNTGSGIGTLILLFIIFVICGAYFGGAESSFSAMNKIRIKAKADDGDKRAKNAMYIASNFDRALTTLLIGNNITHIAAASIATLIATRLFGTSDTVTLYCTIISTLLVFLFSEMIPKSFANDRSETTALLCSGSLRMLMKLLYPFASFFALISSGFTRFIRLFVKHEEEPSITEDELYDIIDTVEEEGVVNEEQGDMLKSAMDFSETCAKDIMTMHDDICFVDASLSNAEILQIVRTSNHTRLPVYDGDPDHIIGILQMRTYIKAYLKNPAIDIRTLLLPAYHVSPAAKINDLLAEMQQHKSYLSIVSDTDNRTLGIVTIEDFLEELVGEIWDEDDIVDKNFVKLGGNRFRVNTHMTIGEVCSRLGIVNTASKENDRPILSLLLENLGRLPKEDDSFLYDHFAITVDTVDDQHVDSVILWLLSDEELEDYKMHMQKPSREEADA